MRLWRIQLWNVWERFQGQGMLRADGRRVRPKLRFGYRWMLQQMARRIPGYGGRYPVWAWYFPKSDIRRCGHLPRGTRGVRIKCSIPRDRVLCSDFNARHAVLNPAFLGLSEDEDEAWEGRLAACAWRTLFKRYHAVSTELRNAMEESWERIFDPAALNSSQWMGPVRAIQTVGEEIALDDVVQVRGFRAR